MLIRIGHLSTLYHTSMVFLSRPSLLEGLSFQTEWKLFGTGPAIVDAFSRDEIDLAYIGLPPAIIGMDRGIPLVCIGGGHIEGTVLASSRQSLSFEETDDLCSVISGFRSIGVPGRGSIHDLILSDMLQRCNLKTEVINFRWADEALEAYLKGSIDAAIGTPALAQAIIEYGEGKIIWPPSGLWPNNPSYGILVKKDFLDKAPEVLREFLRLHEEGTNILRDTPEEIAGDIARTMGFVDRDFVLKSIGISPRYCASITDEYISCTMVLSRRMLELGYIGREFTEDEVFDLRLIREIHPGNAHY